VQQSLSDAALTKCPNCQGELVKVFGNVGVTFKGSGFYINDSGSSGTSSGGKKE
jgi:predicted nucleic acid-binding Zn ribbon protein